MSVTGPVVGAVVGVADGSEEGAVVGAAEGSVVGSCEGIALGEKVGSAVGSSEGMALGKAVEEAEGDGMGSEGLVGAGPQLASKDRVRQSVQVNDVNGERFIKAKILWLKSRGLLFCGA